ncbi:MAG: zinc-ribbon domain-containing protein, partial [Gemmatimonadetes bacterium]|nr:zinc-ribbon domain-containing protein [Gemmatimonadota bacterium]
MNVACPTCATTYRVDPAKIPASGVRARCQVCAAVFPISTNGTAPAPRPSTAAGAPAQRPAIPSGLRPSGMHAAPPAPPAAPARPAAPPPMAAPVAPAPPPPAPKPAPVPP